MADRHTVIAPPLYAGRVNGDQLVAIRDGIADYQRGLGFPELAERIRAGEADQLPIMQAAVIGAERVLRGMFG